MYLILEDSLSLDKNISLVKTNILKGTIKIAFLMVKIGFSIPLIIFLVIQVDCSII